MLNRVLCHGPDARERIPRLSNRRIAGFTSFCPICVIQLERNFQTQQEIFWPWAGELRGTAVLQAGFLALRHIFAEDLSQRLPGILRALETVVHHPQPDRALFSEFCRSDTIAPP